MQPSRKQCTNGTQNPNFVMKIGINTPWQVYFPKIDKYFEKVAAGSYQISRWPFFGLFSG